MYIPGRSLICSRPSRCRILFSSYTAEAFTGDNFQDAEEDANEDYNFKMSGIEDLVSGGTLSMGELAEMVKTQQYEITQLRKENTLLKSKLLTAAQQGFSV